MENAAEEDQVAEPQEDNDGFAQRWFCKKFKPIDRLAAVPAEGRSLSLHKQHKQFNEHHLTAMSAEGRSPSQQEQHENEKLAVITLEVAIILGVYYFL